MIHLELHRAESSKMVADLSDMAYKLWSILCDGDVSSGKVITVSSCPGYPLGHLTFVHEYINPAKLLQVGR
jgi:hypothetical protein